MAETGTVKFYLEAQGYGFIIPDSGGKDVYFRYESARVPRVDSANGVYGWDYPKEGEVPLPNKREEDGLPPRVVFVRVVNPEGNPRAISWAYLEEHESAIDVLWHLMARFRFPKEAKPVV